MIHESTLPYQGGIKGGLKAKSIFNLIITSYLSGFYRLYRAIFSPSAAGAGWGFNRNRYFPLHRYRDWWRQNREFLIRDQRSLY
ncbi:MAG: hypothetical protein DWQ51_17150 [Microcystis wesenbergii TW10]|uniref:Uncharacterized protein n=1 Tax=Microcystis wesenbergii TW10 TaxID=2060474 RepID=A0A3E0LPS6_9CHRO|nr:MAG: hypothetical protein DWQ51_17150 [Microcystis wesenbergii TW10]